MTAARRVLSEVFGFEAFRPGQEAVIEALLAGRNALAVMPTGSGKSLCFQVPALVMDGLTVVVSPLVALMQDQVAALRLAGVAANGRERPRDRPLRNHVQFHNRGRAALGVDRRLERGGIGRAPRREHREVALGGELLRHRAAHAPAHPDRQAAVVERAAVHQPGVAPVRLPLGGGPDHHRDSSGIVTHVRHPP